MRKLLLSIAAAFCIAPAATQTRPPRLLDDAVLKELSEKKTIVRVLQNQADLSLAPMIGCAETLGGEIRDFKATVGVEVLRLMPGARASKDQPLDLAMVLTALASASAMKGITYWSVTHNERRILFLESYAVESPRQPVRVPDPVFTSPIPSEKEMYTFQEDSTFGRNIYRSVFRAGSGCIRVTTENTNAITYLFIPVIPAGGLVNHTIVTPTEYGLVFYGAALLRSSVPIGNTRSRAESLTNRVIAAADWLEARFAKQ
jgi:hypothetical protein